MLDLLRERGYIPIDLEIRIDDPPIAEAVDAAVRIVFKEFESYKTSLEKLSTDNSVLIRQMEKTNANAEGLEKRLAEQSRQLQAARAEANKAKAEISALQQAASRAEQTLKKEQCICKAAKAQFAADLRRRDGMISRLEKELRHRSGIATTAMPATGTVLAPGKVLRPVGGTLSRNYNSTSVLPTGLSETTAVIEADEDRLLNIYSQELQAMDKWLKEIGVRISNVLWNHGIAIEPETIKNVKPAERMLLVSSHVDLVLSALQDPAFIDADAVNEKGREIEELAAELAEAKANWHQAIMTMESWSQYRTARE